MKNGPVSRACLAPLVGTLLLLSAPLGCRRLLNRPAVLLLQVATDEIPGSGDQFQSNRDAVMGETIRMLKRRVGQLGASDAVVAAQRGTKDQVRVELWGVTDLSSAQRILTTRGRLKLKLVENSESSRESLLQSQGGVVPPELEVVSGAGDAKGTTIFYLVRREHVISGGDVKSARASVDPQTNTPNVLFVLNAAGASAFERETSRNLGRRLAILLDDRVMSAPMIHSAIKDYGAISGRFTKEEAGELASVLRSGELPAMVTCVSVVGPGA